MLSYDQHAPDIAFKPLAELSTYVLLVEDYPMAQRGGLRLAELADEPFILLDMPVSREYSLALFSESGLTPRIAARSEQPETVRSYVAAGVGFSLLTARPGNRAALTGRPRAYVPLEESFPPMVLGLADCAAHVRRALRVPSSSIAVCAPGKGA